MRRAFRASRLVASVVAQFLYLAFEEAVRARAAQRHESAPRSVPSVHEVPTLPGTVPAPLRDLDAPRPIIRVIEAEPSESTTPVADPLPAVLADFDEAPSQPRSDRSLDVETLLDTLRRDVGCAPGAIPRSHAACRAAEALAAVVDREAVLAALEETVTAANRPGCVRISATGALGRAAGSAAQRALSRMLAVAKGRAAWTHAASDRDLVSLLLHTLDA